MSKAATDYAFFHQTAFPDAIQNHLWYRFPSRFDNSKVHETIKSGSVAPKVELLKPDGNGNFLDDKEVSALMEAIWKNAIFIKWKKGDTVFINNKKMAHARMNVSGPRKIVAAMAAKSL